MWKSTRAILVVAAFALGSLSMMAHAEHRDGIYAQSAASSYATINVMPSLPVIEAATDFNTTAMYALNDVVVSLPSKMVFRDFRTIADSGGRSI